MRILKLSNGRRSHPPGASRRKRSPLFEGLERRVLLSTAGTVAGLADSVAADAGVIPQGALEAAGPLALVNASPLPNTHTSPVDTDVSVTYDQDIDPATVSDRTFVVHGMQTGQLLDPANTMTVTGGTVTLNPDVPFHPGELVQAAATTGIQDPGGQGPAAPFVWQFRTAVTGGTGQFNDSGQRLGGSSSRAVALGDVDGDGDLDAFVGNCRVWLNDGQGTFTDSGQSLGSSYSKAVALGDLDGDGDLDVFVANHGPNRVWLNDGQGTFTDSGQTLGSAWGMAVALGDVDGDGDLDAFVGNSEEQPNRVWSNDGAGVFSDSAQSLGSSYSEAVALGDVDGDGDLDAFVGNLNNPFSNKVWLNDGQGTFTDSGQSLGNSQSYAVALGDVDDDGDLDAFVGNAGATTVNNVWLNDGQGTFTDSGQRLGSFHSCAAALGDLDGDGDLDAFVGNQSDPFSNKVWLNDGQGMFTDSGQNLGGQNLGDSWTMAVALGDLDGDGDLDAFVGNHRAPDKVWLNGADFGDAPLPYPTLLANSGARHLVTGPTLGSNRDNEPDGQPTPGADGDDTTGTPDDEDGVVFTSALVGGQVATVDVTASDDGLLSAWMDFNSDGDWADAGEQIFSDVALVAGVNSLSFPVPATPPDRTYARFRLSTAGGLSFDGLAPDGEVEDYDTRPDVNPVANSHAAPVDTDVSVTYHHRDIDLASVSDETFVVHGMQTGQLLDPPDTISVSGPTVTLDPAADFHPGELVHATATTGIQNVGGYGSTDPFVWQFRTAVTGGTGYFNDSGQRLGSSNSKAVALGDLDGDGDLDAFVGNYGAQPNRVWLNSGQGTFSDSGQGLGNSDSLAVALGDVDGDGDLDAFVANSNSGDTVWRNDGQGEFSDSGQRLGGSHSRAVALGDLDGDGDLDAFITVDLFQNSVWVNDGEGRFIDSGQRLGTWGNRAVALGDLDGDGDLDALVAKQTGNNEVWLNDGQGHFDMEQALSISTFAVALGDVDGDGDLDAFFDGDLDPRFGGEGSAATVWLNVDGKGHFVDSGQRLGSSWASAVALGDFDSDGDLDAFVGRSYSVLANKVWLNDGGGTFSDSGQNLSSSTSHAVAMGDVDGDGDLDAVVGNGGANKVWLNKLPEVVQVDAAANSHTAPVDADVSGTYDQDIDPASASDATFVVHGMQTGQLLESAAPPNVITVSGPTVTLDPAADFHPGELVHATARTGIQNLGGHGAADPFVWQFRAAVSDGTGYFSDSGQALGGPHSWGAALGDLDGDGDLDAFVGNCRVWLNDGQGTFTDSDQRLGSPDTLDLALGDVDGDGDLDAFVGYEGPNKVWRNDGQGSFSDSGQSLGSSRSYAVALGDVDGDGDLDALVGNSEPSKVWLNDGDGTFIDSGQSLGDRHTHVALGDLDGDGDLDAFIGKEIWLNDGQGAFGDSGQSLGGSSSRAVALGDVDGDGDLDAFVGNGYAFGQANEVWLNDGQGIFTDSGQRLGSSYSEAVALGDVDGDGDLDAFVGVGNYDGDQPNSVWLNDGQGTFGDSRQSLGDSWSKAVALGDVDGDGDLDAFVGNHGGPDKVWLNRAPQVVRVDPAANTHTAPVGADVAVGYDQDMAPASVSDRTFVVHGMQTGQLLESAAPPNVITVSGPTLTLDPAADFHPGELVHATATTGIQNVGGYGSTDPFVWQFRTAVTGGTGYFNDSGQRLGGSSSRAVALGDVDGDGNLDAFVGNGYAFGQANEVWLNDGQGIFTDSGQTLGDSDSSAVALGDVDGDGDLDVFVANDGPNRVWMNDGQGAFDDSGQSLGSADDSYAVALGDMDGDGDLDAFVANDSPSEVWLNDGEGRFSDSGQNLGSSTSYAVALGDVDGDGDLDAFLGKYFGGDDVWLNDGQGTFTDSGQRLEDGDSQSNGVSLGDLDGDGDLDAFVANTGYGWDDRVWLNDGQGIFTDSGQRLGDSDSNAVALGDVDGDGDLDALVDGENLWVNDGQGQFADSGQSLATSGSIALGDVDGDGDLDAFIGTNDANQVWLNLLLIVSTAEDEDDGDHSAGNLSFREALGLAKEDPGLSIVRFDPGLAGSTIHLSVSLGQLEIGGEVDIEGLGSEQLRIDAGGNSRVFSAGRGVTARLSDLTVAGGHANRGAGMYVAEDATVDLAGIVITGSSASHEGGAVFADLGSTVTLTGCTISDNDTGNEGGGIHSEGTLRISDTTISGNAAVSSLPGQGKGGGLHASGDVHLANTTISGNEASIHGGGIYAEAGTVHVTNVTVTDNQADSIGDEAGEGGGIYSAYATVTLHNTIVAGNVRGEEETADDVAGILDVNSSNNLIGTDPGLMPLDDYGGPTRTHGLRVDSPAIDAGSDALAVDPDGQPLTTDQRGLTRFVDHDRDGSATVDIGAYEAAAPIVVDALNDEDTDTDGLVSLREALGQAAGAPGFDVIRFDAGLAGRTIALDSGLGELILDSNVDIQGLGADQLRIDAGGSSRVFHVGEGVLAFLSGMTITRGNADIGGGIYNQGRLTVADVALVHNSATNDGGAIYTAGSDAALTLMRSTLSDNSAGQHGGGMYAETGQVTLTNSTLSGNTAGSDGGGLYVNLASVTSVNATITDNEAGGEGGGVCVADGGTAPLLHNTILAGNTAVGGVPDDGAGPFDANSSFNVVGAVDASLASGQGTQTEDPKLLALGYYDEPGHVATTRTHGLQAKSPAIDLGSNERAREAGLTTDQRGLPRRKDGLDDGDDRIDIGAFEQQVRLNIKPAIQPVDVLEGAVENRLFRISYDRLLQATHAEDEDAGDTVQFRIEKVDVGTLTKDGQPVQQGQTTLAAGEAWVWAPPADTSGRVEDALWIRAWDGQAPSELTAIVDIEIAPQAEPVNYAVLFSGGIAPGSNHERYYKNLKALYEVLVGKYHLGPHNIYVLYADGRDPGADQPNGDSDLSFAAGAYVAAATRQNLRQTLVWMSQLVDLNDHFLFWSFDHGNDESDDPGNEGGEVLNGWGDLEVITDEELAVWLKGLHGQAPAPFGVEAGYAGIEAGSATYVFAQCYSGGMLDNLVPLLGENEFGMASTTHFEGSHGDAFAAAFTQALRSGYRYTRDAYRYTLEHDGHAREGEGPNGTRSYSVEHPWSVGEAFAILHQPGDLNSPPHMLASVHPLKRPLDLDYLDITYDMLMAVTEADDDDGDAPVFQIASVDIGTMTKDGQEVIPGETDVRFGDTLRWEYAGGGPGAIKNAFWLVLLDGDVPYAPSQAAVPIRIGAPTEPPAAFDDEVTLQQGSGPAALDVLGNDRLTAASVVRSVGRALHGNVQLDPGTGDVIYAPSTGFRGEDVFSYVVADGDRADIGRVAIQVVDYDPNAVPDALGYVATQLTPPPGWAGLPDSWNWQDRQLPDWQTTVGVDISKGGYVLVNVERPQADELWYTGGPNAAYMWWPDSTVTPPFWNQALATDPVTGATTHVTSTNAWMFLDENVQDNPDDPTRKIVNGIGAISLRDPSQVVSVRYLDPWNADEYGYPPVWTLGRDVGQPDTQLWQVIGEGLDPHPKNVDLEAEDVNRGGQGVVNDAGTSWSPLPQRAVIWDSSVPYKDTDDTQRMELPGWDGFYRSRGEAINDAGHVVGQAEYGANGLNQGFYYGGQQDGNGDPILTRIGVLDTLGHNESRAVAVNEHDQAVGNSWAKSGGQVGPSVAFRWDAIEGMVNLGTLSSPEGLVGTSVAYDISDSGLIVGSSDGHAAIWLQGQIYDLNALCWGDEALGGTSFTLTRANAINDAGQIVATGDLGGQTRAFYLNVLKVRDDAFETPSDQPVTIWASELLYNDSPGLRILDVDASGTAGAVTWDAGTGYLVYDPAGRFDHLKPGEQAPDSFTYTAALDEWGTGQAEGTVTITVTGVVGNAFAVKGFEPTTSGFDVKLSRDVDLSVLNLYGDAQTARRDVTLVGDATGPVLGSLVWDAASRTLSFVASGGVLTADRYTAVLETRLDGVVSTSGQLLEGTGVADGAYSQSFVVDAPSDARAVWLSDVARAPGEVPGPEAGPTLSVAIADGQGVEHLQLTLEWNEDLLTVAGATLSPSLPAGWQFQQIDVTPGQATVSLFGTQPLSTGPQDLLELTASVPQSAPYGASQRLRLTSAEINQGTVPSLADQAVHLVASPGDVDADGVHTPSDAWQIAGLASGVATYWTAYPRTSPVLAADVTENGNVSSQDAAFAARLAAGLPLGQIPQVVPALSLPSQDAVPGSDITIPVMLPDAAGLQSADLLVQYDPAVLSVAESDVALGELTQGWAQVTDVDEFQGQARVAVYNIEPLSGGAGSIVELRFAVRADAPLGPTNVEVAGASLLNESAVPTPSPSATVTVVPIDGVQIAFAAQSGSFDMLSAERLAVTVSVIAPADLTGFQLSFASAHIASGQLRLENWTTDPAWPQPGDDQLDTPDDAVVSGLTLTSVASPATLGTFEVVAPNAGGTYLLTVNQVTGGALDTGFVSQAGALRIDHFGDVIVRVNMPPAADAGDDQEVIDTDGDWFEMIALDGSGSTDAEGIASYVWTEDGAEIATGADPDVELAVGDHTIELTVTDTDGAADTDQVEIFVAPLLGGQPLVLIWPVTKCEVEVGQMFPAEWYGGTAETRVRVLGLGPVGWQVLAEDLPGTDGRYNWDTAAAAPGWYCFTAEVHHNGQTTYSHSRAWAQLRAAGGVPTAMGSPSTGSPRQVGDNRIGTMQDTTVTTDNLAANDAHPDDDPLDVVGCSPPAHGAVAYTGAGRFTYAPEPDAIGEAPFTYAITDGEADVDLTEVRVLVEP